MLNTASDPPRRRLARELEDAITAQIRGGALTPGGKLPTEAQIMAEHGVSRTVVREAISRLQAGGMVQTRHGIGTFVAEAMPAGAHGFRILPDDLTTLTDVIAVLELRIGVETEAAALAAMRRSPHDLAQMRQCLHALHEAVESGADSSGQDFDLHVTIARATHNTHFVDLMSALGTRIIPRARLNDANDADSEARRLYLRRVNAEHENLVDAIASRDAEGARAAMRIHLGNSRERRRRAAGLSGISG